MRQLGGVEVLHGDLWRKRVKVILRDFYFADFFHTALYLYYCCLQRVQILEKSQHGRKS